MYDWPFGLIKAIGAAVGLLLIALLLFGGVMVLSYSLA
jgi:hypothetical protein